MTLTDISNIIIGIIGDASDELSEHAEADLAELECAFDAKIDALLCVREDILGDIAKLKAEIQRRQKRVVALDGRAEWIREYVHRSMKAIGVKKVKTPEFTATVAKSPVSVTLQVGEPIPFEYKRETVTASFDKAKAIDDFKAGIPLPESIIISQDNTNLRIT